jgi:hypothetical protein
VSKTDVKSADQIRDALRTHVVSTRIESPNGTEARIIEDKLEPCPHCTRDDFKSKAGRVMHINSCIRNPRRKSVASKPCEKCGVETALRSYKSHIKKCTGDAEATLARKKYYEGLKKRKAKALKNGKEFVSQRGKRATTTETPKPRVQSHTDYDLNLDDMIGIMAKRFIPVMGSRHRELTNWIEQTEKLWQSV